MHYLVKIYTKPIAVGEVERLLTIARFKKKYYEVAQDMAEHYNIESGLFTAEVIEVRNVKTFTSVYPMVSKEVAAVVREKKPSWIE